MKIYISGAITNNPNYMDEFCRAEEYLMEEYPNAEILNPAKTGATLPKSTTWNEYMSICYLLLDMCDTVYMLKGWKKSSGSCIEFGYAMAMDKMVLEQ